MKIIQLFIVITLSLYSDIGYISALKGDVSINRGTSSINAKIGTKIEDKDSILTGRRTKVQIIFKDKTVIRLGQNTEFNIEKYLYDKSAKSTSKFKVKKGFFDVVTGHIGKIARENFKLKVKTATIGVRGTHFQGSILEDSEEVKCISGVITIDTDQDSFQLKAGESIDLHSRESKIASKISKKSNLEDRYNIELSKEILLAISNIRNSDTESYGIATGLAYNDIRENLTDPVEIKYAEALMLREAYEMTIKTFESFAGKQQDLTDQFFEDSIAKFGNFELDPNLTWVLGDRKYTDYRKVIESMGGVNAQTNDVYSHWNGKSNNREIGFYKGYALVEKQSSIDDEQILSISKENSMDIKIDFGNRSISYGLTTDNKNINSISLNEINQYGLVDAFVDTIDTSSTGYTSIMSFGSYYYGSDIDEVGGEFTIRDEASFSIDEYGEDYKFAPYHLTFIAKKDSVASVYKKSIDSDNIFSWGYWAYSNQDGEEKLRGSWIDTDKSFTSQDKIQDLIDSSALASYSGQLFGTAESPNDGSINTLSDGEFKLNFNFGDSSIDGDFKFNVEDRGYSIKTDGYLTDSSFKLSGDNFTGDGRLFGEDAENIGGGFYYKTDKREAVIGVFKGAKE